MSEHLEPDDLSRISKIFLDRDNEHPDKSTARREQQKVVLACGLDVCHSYTLQLALRSAAMLANRCFPKGVRVVADEAVADSMALVGDLSLTLRTQLIGAIGYDPFVTTYTGSDPTFRTIVLGDAQTKSALRITFDGWIAKVGPARLVSRLAEREHCPTAGIAAAALAISEIFLEFAEINIEAGSRTVAMSLWRPDLDPSNAAALGVPLEILPARAWILGLGHLGQAYLWGLATLPYISRENVELFLNDFDRVIPANVETGLLLGKADQRKYKTRVCANWLERYGFRTRIIERPFGPDLRCDPNEPALALCGFDKNPARQNLGTANFRHVVECGLGGTAENFDVLNLHTLPGERELTDLWPEEVTGSAVSVAANSARYNDLADECGRIELAGKAVAVPFVGAIAGCMVVAEVLRMLHGGPSFAQIKFRLATPGQVAVVSPGSYESIDSGALEYVPADEAITNPSS